ncbi:MAG: hypothetical protein R3F03_10190 [Opitutaceae bacterium]
MNPPVTSGYTLKQLSLERWRDRGLPTPANYRQRDFGDVSF